MRKKEIFIYKQKKKPIFKTLIPFLILVLIAFGVTYYFLTRPASVFLTSNPPDCKIKLEGFPPQTGKLTLSDLKSGTYWVEIRRKGFEPITENIKLSPGEKFRKHFALKSKLLKFALKTEPEKVNFSLRLSDGSIKKGKTPFQSILPAGKTKIKLSLSGYNPLEKEIFLDSPTNLKLYLDPKGQLLHLLQIIECGPAPKGASFTPDGKEIWVTLLGGPPSVEVYNPLNGKKLSEINLDRYGAVEITFSSDGSRAYVSQMETAKVYEIDTKTHRVSRTFKTESAWSKVVELSKDEKTLFVSNWSGNDISEIDLESGKLRRRLSTVKTPRGLYTTADGRYLYVAGFGRGEIDLIDLSKGKGKIIFNRGGAVRHLAGDERRGMLFASDLGKDCIWKVELKTNEVKKFARTDRKPNTIDLSPDGKVLFVSCRGANNPKSYYLPGPEWGSVVVIDTTTGKTLDAIVGGNQCTALDVSPDGKLLVFSDFLDNRLRVYSIPSYEVLLKGGGGRVSNHQKDLKK
jgi:DNA-binding beta-propeller fold protein YncE